MFIDHWRNSLFHAGMVATATQSDNVCPSQARFQLKNGFSQTRSQFGIRIYLSPFVALNIFLHGASFLTALRLLPIIGQNLNAD
jgi:hypothetical protein